jgi:hypothetical protein
MRQIGARDRARFRAMHKEKGADATIRELRKQLHK